MARLGGDVTGYGRDASARARELAAKDALLAKENGSRERGLASFSQVVFVHAVRERFIEPPGGFLFEDNIVGEESMAGGVVGKLP
jgi:hypothetical protein